ncbi:hypothetical protein ACFE04_025458 [Oxalis oulophora]
MRAASKLFKLILHCDPTMPHVVRYNFIYARCFGCKSAAIKNNRYKLSCFLVNNCNGHYQLITTHASSDENYLTDEVFNQMLATGENPDAFKKLCSDHLDKLCKAGNFCAATRLLQFIRDKNIFISPAAYNRVLASAAADEKIDFEFSVQVFKDLIISCRVLSSASYLNLAQSFTSTNDSVQLLRFVKEVSELAFPSGTTVVNRIILAFAECGQIENALLIFDQMADLKCNRDLITYNTIFDVLGRSGRVNEMQHEFKSMKEAGIDPDFVSYNTLINSFRKLGRLDMCLVFLREMCDKGIKPDLLTFTALIEAFGRSGNIEEALKLFDEMKQRKIKPSVQTYRSIITNLKRMGKVELAIKYAEEMNLSLSDLAGPDDFKSKERLLRNRKSRP